ncbi:MAG TPA: type II toxin-antitoxin system HicA family toxin [Allocoleopsis sp.]
MKKISGKKLAEILLRKGWRLIRVKGSHHRFQKDGMSISIPIHSNQDQSQRKSSSFSKRWYEYFYSNS